MRMDLLTVSRTADSKPEGVTSELADVLIRIFDFCGKYQLPLGKILIEKMEYNKKRPYRHGGKNENEVLLFCECHSLVAMETGIAGRFK